MGVFWPENQAPAVEGSWDVDPEFWPIRIQIWFLKIGASPNHHRFQWFWGSPIRGMIHEWMTYACLYVWENEPKCMNVGFASCHKPSPSHHHFFLWDFNDPQSFMALGCPHFLGWFEAKTHLEGQIYGIKIRDWAVDVVGSGSGSWGCLSPEQPWHHFCSDACLHLPKEFRKKLMGSRDLRNEEKGYMI